MPGRITLVFALGALVSTTAGARELPIQLTTDGPAWANTTRALIAWVHRTQANGCEIVAEVHARRGGKRACCKARRSGKLGCTAKVSARGLPGVLSKAFGIRTRAYAKPLTLAEVKRAIDRSRPILALMTSRAGQRGVLITGYRGADRVTVLDPIYGRRVLPYPILRKSTAGGLWTASYVVTTKRAGSSRCRRAKETTPITRWRLRCPGAGGPVATPIGVSPELAARCHSRCVQRFQRCSSRCVDNTSVPRCRLRCERQRTTCQATCPVPQPAR